MPKEQRNKDKTRISSRKRKENQQVDNLLAVEEKETAYRGNPKLKRAGEKFNFTPEQVKEFRKCMKDPVYFVSNYVKIIHVDKGLIPIKLYEYQKKVLREFDKNRFNVMLSARQTGKCVFSMISICLRNTKYNNGEPFQMKIGDFYRWQEFIQKMKALGIEEED